MSWTPNWMLWTGHEHEVSVPTEAQVTQSLSVCKIAWSGPSLHHGDIHKNLNVASGTSEFLRLTDLL
jgi:hypothetical protein